MGRIPDPLLSVVIPFCNEEECVRAVCGEVVTTVEQGGYPPWELIMVNDGSTDSTPALIDALADEHPQLRALHLTPNSGQSAALNAGFTAARGELIVTLDGDGQNDPADAASLLREMSDRGVDMMCGVRTLRADSVARRVMGRLANRIRSGILHDGITDVGCSIRVFRRRCLERVRLYRNAHRFLPALFQMNGYSVAEMPVRHRQRAAGRSKYGGGFRRRAFVGVVDLLGAWWLRRRSFHYAVREHERHTD